MELSAARKSSAAQPDGATVLRDAYSNDYMKDVYGRTEF
jgi:hypothetical protein